MQQITDADMQAEMKRLLTGIQVKWLYPRIKGPAKIKSRQSIYDWIGGSGVTFERLQQVAAAVDRPLKLPGHDEEAPAPEWVRGLQRALAAVLQDRGISPDDAERLAGAWAVLERARKQQSPARDVVLFDPDV